MAGKQDQASSRGLSRRALLRLSGGAFLTGSMMTLLAACGGDDDDSDGSDDPTSEPAEGATATSAGEPDTTEQPGDASPTTEATTEATTETGTGEFRSGGDLNVAIGTDISSLEPQVSTETSSGGVRTNMYDSLLFSNNVDGEIVPWLADSWEVSDDGLTYTFTLTEKPVKFHDGTDFTADAVKVTFDRLLHPDRTGAAKLTLDFISSVEVMDAQTVEFTLAKPFAPFLSRMTGGAASIMSPTAIDELGEDYGSNPVGTGPYKFVEYRQGDHVTLERFDEYWNGAGNYDRIIYRITPEDTTRATLLQTGEVQVSDRLSPVLAEQLQDSADVTVQNDFTSRWVFFRLNQNRELMKDVRVRQAVNHAVDKESIVANILKGFGRPATSPLTPAVQFHSAQEPYAYDTESARSLLQEAGVAEGTSMIIWSPQGRYTGDIDWATAVQSMMEDIGLQADLQGFGDFPAYIEELSTLEWDMAIWGWAHGNDPDSAMQLYMSRFSEVFPNWGSYNNPRVDELLETASVSVDDAERTELYAEVQQLVWEDAADLFMHDQANLTGVSNQVGGVFVTIWEGLYIRDSGYIA